MEGSSPDPVCLSLDLEVNKRNVISAIGATRSDNNKGFSYSGKDIAHNLKLLDEFARGVSFVLGHNLISFDRPYLEATKPDLRLLTLPVVDTLRLSPLAFPRNPYHSLVKHYKDGAIKQGQINDPELDSRLALTVFYDQLGEFPKAPPDLLTAWHWLCTPQPEGLDYALDEMFCLIRKAQRPTQAEATIAIERLLVNITCKSYSYEVFTSANQYRWELAYTLAWLSVAGGNSVMPPWVRMQFPKTVELVNRLRNQSCGDVACTWCCEHHDVRKELKRWFGFQDFRPEPDDGKGKPLQQAIVETAMAGKSVLGILPTGTGKSLCYQLPGLSQYDKTGALTVVISPLVALMKDQVDGMEKLGISSSATINGMLSMPERADALNRIRMGEISILLISPEQLRSRSIRRVLETREIGIWVIDEAHCLSRWGHDFRPDYRYVGRFIRERSKGVSSPSVMCLTATAKPDVVEDITKYFLEKLGIELVEFNGGSERTNLSFEVIPTNGDKKFEDIYLVLEQYLPEKGGAIVYCATRKQTEIIAEYLRLKNLSANYFHAGLSPEAKKEVQHQFLQGELRVIVATNAFGMGIDKPDVRLVIHADIPSSLENYLQEAGRAGRDREDAHCVLLYEPKDVERQFSLSAFSRLTLKDIQAVLKALRKLERRKHSHDELIATAGEILTEDNEGTFDRDFATDDSRVRTALSWLEEAELLTREENAVRIFPSSLRITTIRDARKIIFRQPIRDDYKKQLGKIVEVLIEADSSQGITTDELMVVSGLNSEKVRKALYDLESFGIASNDTVITAFVHVGIKGRSEDRLDEVQQLEKALISQMRETAPDIGRGDTTTLHLRHASTSLRKQNLQNPLPERLLRIIRRIRDDVPSHGDETVRSLTTRKLNSEMVNIKLECSWGQLERNAQYRHEAARILLKHLIDRLPKGSRGKDLLAETTIGNLLGAIKSDLVLKSQVKDLNKLLDSSLLWLHEMEVIRLNKGLAIFRPAMTIRMNKSERRRFVKADFTTLDLHYKGQILQIHVIKEFATKGMEEMREALRLSKDYFSMDQKSFLSCWLPGRDKEIYRQTTPESWKAIVENLKNPIQQHIVADDREDTNVLVLAGPGSGKTRVLVHRIAYLIRVRRENPKGIIALTYNRHASIEIRQRLKELIGVDAQGVTILTCHSLAMRLAGISYTDQNQTDNGNLFKESLRLATDLLNGEELDDDEADDQRERLLRGFRWILVDEYQDIDKEQYELISALAGRSLQDSESKLTLFAVGDDDQNIYSFQGASVEFIRKFETDYNAQLRYLTENYRSTHNIVDASNTIIQGARDRMKANHPIRVNKARIKDAPGGVWTDLDVVSKGRVQILQLEEDNPVFQARMVMEELLRMSKLDPDWDWSRCAVIARKWDSLAPVQSFCEARNIPVEMARDEIPNFWRLRQTRSLVDWLRKRESRLVKDEEMKIWLETQAPDYWQELLVQAIDEHALEVGGEEYPVDQVIEWLVEWGREIRRRQKNLLLLTAHRAKGLEFDHVAILDGNWNRDKNEDSDAHLRLYYVAMTRAQKTLTLARFKRFKSLQHVDSIIYRSPTELSPCSKQLYYKYERASLKDVTISFAGNIPPNNRIHKAITDLMIGDTLKIQLGKYNKWIVMDAHGRIVGRMAGSFQPREGMRIKSARVFAIVGWSKELSKPEFQSKLQSENWEVVLPEIIYEPINFPKNASPLDYQPLSI